MTRKEPMPTHVARHLVAEGKMTTGRITHKPQYRRCKRCSAVTIAVLAGSLEVWLWPDPTTPLGELQALTSGGDTWRVHEITKDVWGRRAWDIKRTSADDVDVHVQHRCDDDPPPAKEKPTGYVPRNLPLDPLGRPIYGEPPF